MTFSIKPLKINDMEATPSSRVLFGCDTGIYYDYDTINLRKHIEGSLYNAGVDSVVTSVDRNGTIKSVSRDFETGQVIVSASLDQNTGINTLVGQNLYVTSTFPVSQYSIVSNTTKQASGDIDIQLNAEYSDLWVGQIGNSITVVGAQSTVYLNPGRNIDINEFNDGTMHVLSNENNNQWTIYNIDTTTQSYVVLKEALVPSTVGRIATENGTLT